MLPQLPSAQASRCVGGSASAGLVDSGAGEPVVQALSKGAEASSERAAQIASS